uniref:Cathepsin B n=1 Tax=Rhipicephalus zambeziensis TaxID=60191 RepID=A0A224YBP3_9ACAR
MVPPDIELSTDEMIKFINNLNTTWKAGRNFGKTSGKGCRESMATAIAPSEKERLPLYRPIKTPGSLPESFDAREHWSMCPSIRLIPDQAECGCCWAFGVAGVISDRICIHTRGRVQVNISTEDILTCCPDCTGDGDGPEGLQRFKKKEEDIRNEILSNGPVEAIYQVYRDFDEYKTGVYQRHSNTFCGYHVIRIVGWGTENGVKYWLAANSWSPNWGDGGYFKILRGSNECKIEQYVEAGIPKEP